MYIYICLHYIYTLYIFSFYNKNVLRKTLKRSCGKELTMLIN